MLARAWDLEPRKGVPSAANPAVCSTRYLYFATRSAYRRPCNIGQP